MEVSVHSKQNHMSRLAFPLTDAAIESVQKFKSAETDYVQLSIDLNKEIINVKNQSTCTVQQLPDKVPEDEPRYHLFRFAHTHEGDFLNSTSKQIILGPSIICYIVGFTSRNIANNYAVINVNIYILFQSLSSQCPVTIARLKTECYMLVPEMP